MDKAVERKLMLLIPEPVKKIATTLDSAGYEVFIVGGAIRDIVIGKKDPKEWDMATSAKPQEIASLFNHIYMLGEKFGTITVIMDGVHVEVTTFRSESGYADKRHPQNVDFISDINQDLSRRDFTINAMAFNPINGVFIDLFDGIKDIGLKIIRTVGEAEIRFKEDGLRMMRAVRIATILEYEIEQKTFDAIKLLSDNVKEISEERTRDELVKIISSTDPKRGILLLKATNLLQSIFPESFDLGQIEKACFACELVRDDFDLRMAILITVMKALPEKILLKLRLPKKESRKIKNLVKMAYFDLDESDLERDIRRFAIICGKEDFIDALIIQKALNRISEKGLDIGRDLIQTSFPFSISELKISGSDLITEYGVKPGVYIKVILEELLKEIVEGRISNKYEDLMINAKKIMNLGME